MLMNFFKEYYAYRKVSLPGTRNSDNTNMEFSFKMVMMKHTLDSLLPPPTKNKYKKPADDLAVL